MRHRARLPPTRSSTPFRLAHASPSSYSTRPLASLIPLGLTRRPPASFSLFAGRIQFLPSSGRTFNLPRFCRFAAAEGKRERESEGRLVMGEAGVCAATVRTSAYRFRAARRPRRTKASALLLSISRALAPFLSCRRGSMVSSEPQIERSVAVSIPYVPRLEVENYMAGAEI